MHTALLYLLPSQAGYPAPGCHLAEELQENRECPGQGRRGEAEAEEGPAVSSLDGWLRPHFLSPEPFPSGPFSFFLNVSTETIFLRFIFMYY